MKKFAGNDIVESWRLESQTDRDNATQLAEHTRQLLDQRARYAFSILQAWGMAAAFGDVMPYCTEHGEQKPIKLAPEELAMRVCEVVDATWAELRHRGWIIDQPSLAKE